MGRRRRTRTEAGGGSRRTALDQPRPSLSLCGWVKGRVGLPGCPIGAERHARPLKSRLGSGRGNSPLLSQKVANYTSVRAPGRAKGGASGLRRLLSRSLNAKKPARGVRRAHSPILHLCRYFTVGRRKCQAPSGFGTRIAADESAPQKPWFWRQTSGMRGCLRGSALGFPDHANKFPDEPI
jgi:hypothetical protein